MNFKTGFLSVAGIVLVGVMGMKCKDSFNYHRNTANADNGSTAGTGDIRISSSPAPRTTVAEQTTPRGSEVVHGDSGSAAAARTLPTIRQPGTLPAAASIAMRNVASHDPPPRRERTAEVIRSSSQTFRRRDPGDAAAIVQVLDDVNTYIRAADASACSGIGETYINLLNRGCNLTTPALRERLVAMAGPYNHLCPQSRALEVSRTLSSCQVYPDSEYVN